MPLLQCFSEDIVWKKILCWWCNTSEKESVIYKYVNLPILDSNDDLPIIAGGAAAGGIALAIAIIVVVILLKRYINIGTLFYTL